MPARGKKAGSLLLRDDRAPLEAAGLHFRPAWKFPPGVEAFIEGQLKDAPKPVLNVCSGSSRLGQVKVDLHHPGANVRADAARLPFRNVGTIIMDPPFKMELPTRLAFVQGAFRALRPGGWLLLYAPWMPGRTGLARLDAVWVRRNGWGHSFPYAPVLLTKWVRSALPYREAP